MDKNRKLRNLIIAAFIVFILGIAAGVGLMYAIVNHTKDEPETEETGKENRLGDTNIVVVKNPETDLVIEKENKVEGKDVITGSYDLYFKSCDWGSQLLRVVLELDAPIDEANPEDWVVREKKKGWQDEESEKKITDAFLCDDNGNRTEEPSSHVVLELYTAPGEMTPYVFNEEDLHYEYAEEYEVRVGLNDDNDVELTSMGIKVEDLTMDEEYTNSYTGVDKYSFDEFEASDGMEYKYAHYEAKNSAGDPADTLIVYLHGLNEGGTSRTDAKLMAQLQNTAIFLGDEFQNAMGGASILMPQCPTYWMNQMEDYGEMEFAVVNPYIQSWYTGSLHELINAYKAECGAKRVVIAGFSNGGFMSLMLALTYETEYDGYVCLSEAMWDKSMTDEHITNLAKLPIYFVYCNADNTAPPADYSASTASRIAAKKPKRLHVAALDSILDITNTYYNEDGTPHRFDDHQTEIYFFRNGVKCGSCGLSVWDFMAKVGR